MHALILAAGKARRLYPLCNSQPKCLLRVMNEPIIRHIVASLKDSGIQKITVITGHFSDQVHAELGSEVDYIYNPYFAAASDLVTLWCGRKVARGPFLFLYGDIIFHSDLLRPILSCPEDARLGFVAGKCDSEAEKVSLKEGWVHKISKEIAPEETDGEYVGISAFSGMAAKNFWKLLSVLVEREGNVNMPTIFALQRFIDKDGCRVKALDIGDNGWMEIDYLHDYEIACKEARTILRRGTSPLP